MQEKYKIDLADLVDKKIDEELKEILDSYAKVYKNRGGGKLSVDADMVGKYSECVDELYKLLNEANAGIKMFKKADVMRGTIKVVFETLDIPNLECFLKTISYATNIEFESYATEETEMNITFNWAKEDA